jgi:mono/diheme cytochrome c family protein
VKRGVLLVAVVALAGCRTEQTLVKPDPHLERMLDQEKRLPYEEDPILPGGMAMQRPPDGTLPIDAPVGEPLVSEGSAGGRWAERIPVAVDRAMVDDGRRDFDTFCATCHGVRGNGESVVARKMAFRKPQDLLADSVRAYPPGRVFDTIRHGYGLMPSYRAQLSVRATWGVVAYVRALQLAQGIRVADLPPDLQAQLSGGNP